MGTVWFCHKAITISLWETVPSFENSLFFAYCHFSATIPFQISCLSLSQSPSESSFDKTQKGENLPLSSLARNSSVSFLKRNLISEKLSLWEEPRQAYCWFWKSNKPLQFRISTKVFTELKEVSSICWSQKTWLLFLKLQSTTSRDKIIPLISVLGFPIYQKREPEVFFSLYLNIFITLNTSFSLLWGKQHYKFFHPPLSSFFTTPHANCFLPSVPEINSTLETHQKMGHDPSCHESHCRAFSFPFHAFLLSLPVGKWAIIHSANIHNERGCHSDQDHQGYQ